MPSVPKWLLGFFALWTIQGFSSVYGISDPGDTDLGCPEGAYREGSYCYKVSASSVTYAGAGQFCREDGGFLAIFNNARTKEFVQKLGLRTFFHRYWIGLQETKREMGWRWSDKKKLMFDNWAPGEPNNHGDQLHCANLWLERDLQWDDENCEVTMLFVCEYEDAKRCTKLPKLNQSCFEVSQEFLNFKDATSKCKLQGGHLAHVRTEETSDFLKRIIFADRRWLDRSLEQVKNVINDHSFWKRQVWIGGVNQSYPNISATAADVVPVLEIPDGRTERSTKCPAVFQSVLLLTNCDKNISLICQYPVKPNFSASQTTPTVPFDVVNEERSNASAITTPTTEVTFTSQTDTPDDTMERNIQIEISSTSLVEIVKSGSSMQIAIILASIGVFCVVAILVVTLFLKYRRRSKNVAKFPDQEQSFDADDEKVQDCGPDVKRCDTDSVGGSQTTEPDMDYVRYHDLICEAEQCDERCGNGFIIHRTLL